jgi:hypothetical protein
VENHFAGNVHGSEEIRFFGISFFTDLPEQAWIVFGRYFCFLRKRGGNGEQHQRNSQQGPHIGLVIDFKMKLPEDNIRGAGIPYSIKKITQFLI